MNLSTENSISNVIAPEKIGKVEKGYNTYRC